MKRIFLVLGTAMSLYELGGRPAPAAEPVEIVYQASDLGGGKWAYDYVVRNVSFDPGIEEFTIFFDYGVFASLVIDSSDEIGDHWDQLVVQPDDFLKDEGFYDAAARQEGVAVGEEVVGFRVVFDWLGDGAPGSQRYDVVDPQTFEILYSSRTIPEPSTFMLMGVIAILLRRPVRVCSAASTS